MIKDSRKYILLKKNESIRIVEKIDILTIELVDLLRLLLALISLEPDEMRSEEEAKAAAVEEEGVIGLN